MRYGSYPILYHILAIGILVCVQACSGDSAAPAYPEEAGSATFSIEWPEYALMARNGIPSHASAITDVDCDAYGVTTVTATFTTSSGSHLASESWPCLDHTGTVDRISAGSDRRIIVSAKDNSGNEIYRGEKTGIIINAGQTTYVGSVPLEPLNMLPAPDDLAGWYSGFGPNGVGIWGRPVTGATTYNLYMSTDGGATYTESDIQPVYTLENQNAFLFLTDITSNTYFRVTAVASDREGAYSSPLYIEYTNRASMPQVTVTSPTSGSTGVSLTPTIAWEPYTGGAIAGYIVQIREVGSAFEMVLMKCPTSSTSWTMGALNDVIYNYVDTMSPALKPGTQYGCGIGAVDSNGSTIAASKTILFTTAASP